MNVSLGVEGNYVGTFLAPDTDVVLEDDAVIKGALYGTSVIIKKRASLVAAPAIEMVVRFLLSN